MLNGRLHTPTACDGNLTLLDYIRNDAKLKGTKEGCASGDCGACTVLVATSADAPLRAINSCITPLGNLNDAHVFTVEALSESGALHPAQRAMVEHHGSQCGFCTPGIVMALTALYHNSQKSGVAIERDAVTDAISGNLCRCTGYRPIIAAGLAMSSLPAATTPVVKAVEFTNAIASGLDAVLDDGEHKYFQPTTEAELQALLAKWPDAVLVAGGTDLGLELTQRFRQYAVIIGLNAIGELKYVGWQDEWLEIGAALPYTDFEHFIAAHSTQWLHLLHRLGSRQIRNQGTFGGNVANGSPIADTPPILLALDGEVEITDSTGTRTWHALSDFYLGYRKTILQPGQYLSRFRIPRAAFARAQRFFKLSKRFEDDISTVLGAFTLDLSEGKVTEVRLAFGGVAATPVRALRTEATLLGQDLSEASIAAACKVLAEELTPISDVRASKDYRSAGACNLLRRALVELRDGVDLDVHHYSSGNEAALYAQAD